MKRGRNARDTRPVSILPAGRPPSFDAMPKCLLQIPARFAIEMCERGWILRNEIIWHMTNGMPVSVKDRFTVEFEKLLFFTKSRRYYFERQIENVTGVSRNNKRCVWSATTASGGGLHFAVCPSSIVETAIRAGCPPNRIVLDPFVGSGTTAVAAARLGREFAGTELNADYAEAARGSLPIVKKGRGDKC